MDSRYRFLLDAAALEARSMGWVASALTLFGFGADGVIRLSDVTALFDVVTALSDVDRAYSPAHDCHDMLYRAMAAAVVGVAIAEFAQAHTDRTLEASHGAYH